MNSPTDRDVLLTAAPHPFRVERVVRCVPEGLTIDEMLDWVQPDPVLRAHSVAFIAGHRIPRELWHRVRPRAGAHLELRVLPSGGAFGGGGGGKSPLRTILTIAVIAIAIAAPYAFPALGTPLVIGGVSLGISTATLATAAIGAIGLLAVNAIAPIRPPKLPTLSSVSGRGTTETDSPTLFIQGARNRARPFSPVPVVLGKHRMVPPYGAQPFTEVIGEDQYVRLLFVWGVGPLSVDESTFKIGETPLTEFEGVEVETANGDGSGSDVITLYSDTVQQQDLAVALTQAADWETRTSDDDADELSVDVTFPRGLVQFDNSGGRIARDVVMEIQYRKAGDSTWLTPIFTATTAPAAWIDGDEVTFSHKKTAAIRHGFRWDVAERGQYEVRLRRTSADTNDSQIVDELAWTALRAITDEDPVQSPVPVARTAVRIKATDQLNRIVDEFSGEVTSIGYQWDGVSSWVADQEIQNPADLFRLVLQGAGNAVPLPDARLDLDTLQTWHDFCEARGFKFNMVRDFTSSVWETLADVCGAGRAAPTQLDGKWSVVIEQEQSVPVSHVTPRNSFDFRVEKAFFEQPHAWRIAFPNENEGYRLDERRVYQNGYDANNATKFEPLELPGVTDPDLIFRLGRFRVAQLLLHPERWSFQQDMEYLTYRRGDRIAVTHDILLVGLASGRVKSVEVDTDNDVTGVTLDQTVTMEAATDYGLSVRTILGGQVTAQVVTDVGDQTEVMFSTPVPNTGGQVTIEVGDLFGFGLLGSETDDASVVAITPGNDFRARVAVVPYRSALFDTEVELLPTFTTNLTPVAFLPAPTVRGVESDEAVLALGPGQSLRTRIAVDFDPLNDPRLLNPTVEVQARPTDTGEPYFKLPIDEASESRVIVSGVQDGESWDLRVRFRIDGRAPGPWSNLAPHTVVGKSTPPAGLEGLTISSFNGQAFLRWDRPTELDVAFGGEVRFRHSPDFSGATWSSSAAIGEAARARSLLATLPLKPGTYLARVFDVSGFPSDDIATVTTKQASVLQYAILATLDEDPTFSGTKTGLTVDSGELTLGGGTLMDDIADFDAVSDLDTEGGIIQEGTYEFSDNVDLTSVSRVRVTTRVDVSTVSVLGDFDERTELIDTWEDFDGSGESAEGDILVETRHTDDDPDGTSPDWSDWERLDSAEFEARGFEFRATLSTSDPTYNVRVSELGIDVEDLA